MADSLIFPNAEPTFGNAGAGTILPDTNPNPEPTLVEFEGAKYAADENGNLLNPDKTLFLSKDEYEKRLNPQIPDSSEQVNIDGKIYNIDKNGNAIDETGNVFKTKSELESLFEEVNEPVGLQAIQKLTGLELVDKDNNPIVYEDTPEGIAQYVSDSHNYGRQIGRQEALNDLVAEIPIIESIVTHIRAKGSLEGFDLTQQDYSSVKINPDNKDQMKSLITKELTLKGEDDPNYLVSLIEADNKLQDRAEKALQYIQKYYQDVNAANTREIAAKQAAKEREIADTINNIKSVVTAGKFEVDGNVFTIPAKLKIQDSEGRNILVDREALISYMTEPIEYVDSRGNVHVMTNEEYDRLVQSQQKGINGRIAEAIGLFTKTGLSQLVSNAVKDNAAKVIKTLRSKETPKGTNTNTHGRIILPNA